MDRHPYKYRTPIQNRVLIQGYGGPNRNLWIDLNTGYIMRGSSSDTVVMMLKNGAEMPLSDTDTTEALELGFTVEESSMGCRL